MGLRRYFKNRRLRLAKNKLVLVGNHRLLANPDHPIETYLNHFKYYSRNLARIARYIEKKYLEYTVVDVGANIGDSIALLRTEGVNQFVHAIEGDPKYVKLLLANEHLLGQVKIHPTYLGDIDGELNISVNRDLGTANIVSNKLSGVTTELVTLDNLVIRENINNIKLLKTDTDGFDFKILRGAFNLLERDKPVLFFEYDSEFLTDQGEDGIEIFLDFKRLGYKRALFYDNYGKFLLSIDISEINLIKQLYYYINRKQDAAFPYYDVCIFHSLDDSLAEEVVEKEIQFYK